MLSNQECNFCKLLFYFTLEPVKHPLTQKQRPSLLGSRCLEANFRQQQAVHRMAFTHTHTPPPPSECATDFCTASKKNSKGRMFQRASACFCVPPFSKLSTFPALSPFSHTFSTFTPFSLHLEFLNFYPFFSSTFSILSYFSRL